MVRVATHKIFGFSWTKMSCQSCSFNYYNCIVQFFENDEKSMEFLRSHGVLPTTVTCPHCKSLCTYRKDQKTWRCRKRISVPKSKKTTCSFTISDFKGSFLHNTNIPPWKIVLFVNHYLSHVWDHRVMLECLNISSRTSVDWRSFCSEVTDAWFQNQDSIGGEGVEVEIGETLIVRRKFNGVHALKQLWLFGGIERLSKRRFVVALNSPTGDKRNSTTLLPLIEKYIKPGSIIYSDAWPAYKNISSLGLHYKHFVINQSENFASSEEIHTQTIERFWRDLKEWIKRPGMKSNYMHQYLARYLFISSVSDKTTLVHQFFIQAARLYPPLSDRKRHIMSQPVETNSSSKDDEKEPQEKKQKIIG